MPLFSTADGCRLYYETHGSSDDSPAVVFLNGLTQTTVNWTPHVLCFKERFRVVTYDARGQGRSDLGDQTLALQRHAADLSALLAHLGVYRCHLVGMSLGARVALAAAGRWPEQIGRLILCSTGAVSTEPGASMVRSWLEALRLGGPDAMAWAMVPVVFGKTFLQNYGHILDKIVKALSWRNRSEALEAQLTALTDYPANIELAESIKAATLVISGDEDLLVSPPSARRLAAACGARHLLLEGVGHSLPAEAPDLFDRMVWEHLTGSRETSLSSS